MDSQSQLYFTDSYTSSGDVTMQGVEQARETFGELEYAYFQCLESLRISEQKRIAEVSENLILYGFVSAICRLPF